MMYMDPMSLQQIHVNITTQANHDLCDWMGWLVGKPGDTKEDFWDLIVLVGLNIFQHSIRRGHGNEDRDL